MEFTRDEQKILDLLGQARDKFAALPDLPLGEIEAVDCQLAGVSTAIRNRAITRENTPPVVDSVDTFADDEPPTDPAPGETDAST